MHTNEPREVEGIELGYDPRDIKIKPIVKVVLGFFAFTLVFYGIGAIVFIRAGWGAHTAFDSRKPIFEGPKLQGNVTAKVDIMAMRQAETKALTTYGSGVGGGQRIPIDRAMELISQRGLPAISSDQPALSAGNTIKENAVGPSTTPSERAPMSPIPAGPVPGSTVPPVPAPGTNLPMPTTDPGMSAPPAPGTTPTPAGP